MADSDMRAQERSVRRAPARLFAFAVLVAFLLDLAASLPPRAAAALAQPSKALSGAASELPAELRGQRKPAEPAARADAQRLATVWLPPEERPDAPAATTPPPPSSPARDPSVVPRAAAAPHGLAVALPHATGPPQAGA